MALVADSMLRSGGISMTFFVGFGMGLVWGFVFGFYFQDYWDRKLHK